MRGHRRVDIVSVALGPAQERSRVLLIIMMGFAKHQRNEAKTC
ncbi:hypothetical protein FOXG_20448 [Fusarium oxysporum f. sp. lycopersici 4287]|uniref:Uncharacterized protein n=2 Tax=Fusarium oxysporum TaxID=5507 RepID=A0A0J9VIE3_FUSO4|nr:hypothetical protein FOXG_20448 [Fusarium oxysporum f. sp. lycopersici 4287]EXK46652.1 hypothetical protein FOMG_00332 [Fusarium oxysporum f. sp. melonis 26406]KNB11034.1 hypothetical protein FOXG_20448 [Fusarium oxysporum f. sp. lycopersici 4287]